jgi:hypothetical protein
LLRVRPKGAMLADAVRLLPDLLRLLRRLAADRSLPRAVRVRLWLLNQRVVRSSTRPWCCKR